MSLHICMVFFASPLGHGRGKKAARWTAHANKLEESF